MDNLARMQTLPTTMKIGSHSPKISFKKTSLKINLRIKEKKNIKATMSSKLCLRFLQKIKLLCGCTGFVKKNQRKPT